MHMNGSHGIYADGDACMGGAGHPHYVNQCPSALMNRGGAGSLISMMPSNRLAGKMCASEFGHIRYL